MMTTQPHCHWAHPRPLHFSSFAPSSTLSQISARELSCWLCSYAHVVGSYPQNFAFVVSVDMRELAVSYISAPVIDDSRTPCLALCWYGCNSSFPCRSYVVYCVRRSSGLWGVCDCFSNLTAFAVCSVCSCHALDIQSTIAHAI